MLFEAAPSEVVSLQYRMTALPLQPCLVVHVEGKKSNVIVMGEKGRAQLVRVERNRILGTMNDVNKMRITFAQVSYQRHPVCCVVLAVDKHQPLSSAVHLHCAKKPQCICSCAQFALAPNADTRLVYKLHLG